MFGVQRKNQAKTADSKSTSVGDAQGGKDANAYNPLWQSLAVSPFTRRLDSGGNGADDPKESMGDRAAEQARRPPPPVLQPRPLMLGRIATSSEPDGAQVTRVKESAIERSSNRSPGEQAKPSDAVALARSGTRKRLPHKGDLEDYFQRDLNNLEAYFGPEATASCDMVRAQAFCAGNTLSFADPSPTLDVVAHEVAHSLQQGGDQKGVSGAPSNLEVAPEDGSVEREAAQEAQAAVSQSGTSNANTSPATGSDLQPEANPQGIHTLAEPKDLRGDTPPTNPKVMLARLPAPADCTFRRKGLSKISPIIKESYDGAASTTIKNGWEMNSWERRWQIYDASDTLVYESFYTIPEPTLVIPKELITGGTAGGILKPWSVWIKVTQTLVPFGGDDPLNFPYDFVPFAVYETAQEYEADQQAQARGEDEWDVRIPGFMPGPKPAGVMTSAGTKVSPEVALEIIRNMSKGDAPFKPELGKGGCSWFVSEGNPYIGTSPGKDVAIQAEVTRPADALVFDEAKLEAINRQIKAEFEPGAEAKYRAHKSIPADKPLNAKQRGGLARFIEKTVESKMWDEVGKQVRESGSKVGEVTLQNSRFSLQGNGKFLVVADASKIQIKGGMSSVVSALESAGKPVEPVVKEAAEKMASRMKWTGRVKTVFRYGGKVLIVVAVAADIYKVYVAEDKAKAVITSVGGWAGASIGAAAFAAWWTPADVAGPWAWVGHGVGTLASGAIGYWIGSESMRIIYELVLEE